MSKPQISLSEVLAQLDQVVKTLDRLDHAWSDAWDEQAKGRVTPESARVEDLLHMATHEMSSSVWFAVQEIRSLLAQRAVRESFPQFSDEQLDAIVAQGWSVPLVKQLHPSFPAVALAELSATVKSLCEQWGKLTQA